jgi:hypothetical protein
MSLFDKWAWIKRNWTYILEDASELGLVFVGGTPLNLVHFKEYRASEDIDLYDPEAGALGTKHEKECTDRLAKRLAEKGFEIKSKSGNSFLIGPNIKIEIFNDGTSFNKIEKIESSQIRILTFDMETLADMKMRALLCRSVFDARDLVDLFVIKKQTGIRASFPTYDCDTMENRFDERLSEIKTTGRKDLLVFQTSGQVDVLPYEEFEEYLRWLYEWLSGFR